MAGVGFREPADGGQRFAALGGQLAQFLALGLQGFGLAPEFLALFPDAGFLGHHVAELTVD